MKTKGFTLLDLSVRKYSLASLPSSFSTNNFAQTKNGRCFQGDAFYARDPFSPETQITKINGKTYQKDELIKLALLLSIFNQEDSAIEILKYIFSTLEEDEEAFQICAELAIQEVNDPSLAGLNYEDLKKMLKDNPDYFLPTNGIDRLNEFLRLKIWNCWPTKRLIIRKLKTFF